MKIYNKLESLGFFEWLSETHNLKDTDMKPEYLDELPLEDIHRTVCNSMAFRWFREKYKMAIISPDWNNKFMYKIFNLHLLNQGVLVEKSGFKSYEEAELACLRKLIEIVKEK